MYNRPSSSNRIDLNSTLSEMVQLCASINSNPRKTSFPNKFKAEVKLASTSTDIMQSFKIPPKRIVSIESPPPTANNDNNAIINEKKKSLASTLDSVQIYYGSNKQTSQTTNKSTLKPDSNTPKGILIDSTKSQDRPKLTKRVSFEDQQCKENIDLISQNYNNPPNITSTASMSLPSSKQQIVAGNNQTNNSNILFSKKQTPTRPSLSEQLAVIADKASQITADIKSSTSGQLTFGTVNSRVNESPILAFPVRSFSIGVLTCRTPTTAYFYQDRMEYVFSHPYQSSIIQLVMFYRDMEHTLLLTTPSPGRLQFRVPRKLVHFATDYDPTRHYITLQLSSSSLYNSIRSIVLPIISRR
jgi:hypothetical protein